MKAISSLRFYIVVQPALLTLVGLIAIISLTAYSNYQKFKSEVAADSSNFKDYVLNSLQVSGGGSEFERSVSVIRGGRNIHLLVVTDQAGRVIASSLKDLRARALDDAVIAEISRRYQVPIENLRPEAKYWRRGVYSSRAGFRLFNLGDLTGGEMLVIWNTEALWSNWIASTIESSLGILLIGVLLFIGLYRSIWLYVQRPLSSLANSMTGYSVTGKASRPHLPTTEWIGLFGVFETMIKNIDRHHAELQEAQRAAEVAAEARKSFLSNMTHEMRTPLNGVIGMVEDLSSGGLSAEQADKVEIMRESSFILLSLINDILDFSKIDAGRIELENADFDLRSCVDSISKVSSDSARRKGITIEVQYSSDLPAHVHGDAGRLRQILLNLVGNAIKFTNSGGVAILVSRSGDVVSIGVRDSGVGMTGDQIAKLFKPFSQADQSVTRKYGGTGLGLVISRELARLMGGDIIIESTPGEGSTFTVSALLPVSRAPLTAQPPQKFAPRDYSRLRVLVVEDNPVNQTVIRSLLKKFAITPVFAEDGQSGFEAAKTAVYDVIFMDLQMPVMSGLEATQLIRRNHGPNQKTRIVALTANASSEDVEACEAAGMDSFLSKPLTLNELAAELEKSAGGGHAA